MAIEIKRLLHWDADPYLATIAPFGAQAFHDTFVGKAYYTSDIINGYNEKAFSISFMRSELAEKGDRITYFLMTDNGRTLGYAKVVDREPEACVPKGRPLYLERLYVDRAEKGRGHGRAMMHEIWGEVRRRGGDGLWLSVWENNEAAIAFYLRLGFRKVGSWDWPFESRGIRYVDTDWIMFSALPPPEQRPSPAH